MGRSRAQSSRFALISLLGMTLGMSACQPPAPVVHVHSEKSSKKGLLVIGEGEVEVVPDKVTIRFGVRERDSESELAMQKVEKKAQAMLKMLSDLGIPEKMITTDQVSLFERTEGERRYFERSRRPPEDIVHYYEGIYMVSVELHDFEKVQSLLSAVRKVGVNRVSDISYDAKEREPYFEQARAKAIAHAMKQAKEIAKNAGQELGEVLSIETAWGYDSEFEGGRGVPAGLSIEEDSGRILPIRPGTMTFGRKIRMRFSLKDGHEKK